MNRGGFRQRFSSRSSSSYSNNNNYINAQDDSPQDELNANLNVIDKVAIQRNLVKHRLKDNYLALLDDDDDKSYVQKVLLST